MKDEQALERLAAAWVETGPTRAPEGAVRAALARVEGTSQELDLRLAWRRPATRRPAAFVALGALTVAIAVGVLGIAGGAPERTAAQPAVANGIKPAASTPVPTTAPARPSPRVLALDRTYASQAGRYSIELPAAWKVRAASAGWSGPAFSDPGFDKVAVPGTDTTIVAASQPLPAGMTFEAWLAAFRDATTREVGRACDGGDPASWPPAQVGARIGRWQQLCSAAQVVVEVDGRVYVFGWWNDTGEYLRHLSVADFRLILQTVRFEGP